MTKVVVEAHGYINSYFGGVDSPWNDVDRLEDGELLGHFHF